MSYLADRFGKVLHSQSDPDSQVRAVEVFHSCKLLEPEYKMLIPGFCGKRIQFYSGNPDPRSEPEKSISPFFPSGLSENLRNIERELMLTQLTCANAEVIETAANNSPVLSSTVLKLCELPIVVGIHGGRLFSLTK